MPYIDQAARVKLDKCVKDLPFFGGDEGLGKLTEVVSFIGAQALMAGGEGYTADYDALPWKPQCVDDWSGLARGEYNFLVSMACHQYALCLRPPGAEHSKYQTYNDLVGATEFCIGCLQTITNDLDVLVVVKALGILRCSQLEMYRVVIAGYENIKMLANMNISELDKPFFDSLENDG